MLHQNIPLTIDYAAAGLSGTAQATLTTYVITHEREMDKIVSRPAVVVCPGGGYGFCPSREAEPIARRFLAAGFQAFVLTYSIKQLPFPAHLLQAATAVATVREHAAEWDIDPNKIFIIGFSAGAHLAGSLGTLWNRDYVKNALGYHNGEHRPNGMILSYPVITSGEYAHRGSFDNLLLDGKDDPEKLLEVSLEKQVSADTVPAFLWHTVTDAAVPVENSLLMATALQQNHIPYEMHLFPEGRHGLSLASFETGGGPEAVTTWPDLVIRWITDLKTTENP